MAFFLPLKSKLTQFLLNLTLKEKLGFTFGISTFLLSILFSLITTDYIYTNIQKSQGYLLKQINNELINTFARLMYRRSTDVRNMSYLSEFRDKRFQEENRRFLLEKLQESYSSYAWIGFADTAGKVQVATKSILEGENVKERPWFVAGMKDNYVGDVHEAKLLATKLPPLANGEPLRFLDVAHPVYNANNELIGVIGAHLSWQWIEDTSKSLMMNLPSDQQINIFIVNREGKIIFDAQEQLEGQYIQNYIPSININQSEISQQKNLKGEEYLISYGEEKGYLTYPGLGWRILVTQPTKIAFQPADQLRQKILIWGLGLATIFSILGWYVAKNMTQPLLNLAYQADQIRKGNRNVSLAQIPLDSNFYQGKNEILLLSSSMSDLVQNLINQENQLKRINKELEIKVLERTEELKKAKENAEKANQAKSIFLSNMSHELRTPLNAILGFSQIIKGEDTLTLDNQDNLNIIINSGEHLLSLINEVLELSKIEAGQLKLNNNQFNLYNLLESLQSMLQIKATENNIDLIFNLNDNLPKYVIADEIKLKQILLNLISNALKFTKKGSIVLEANLSTDNKLYFAVKDTGMGMKPEELNKLFTPFFQTESGIKSKQGTGLGLLISRQFVGLMGGIMNVESEFNKGTTFEFTIDFIPIKYVNATKDLSTKKIIGITGKTNMYRILIVDDHEDNRLLLYKLLQPLNFEIKEAINGKEAVKITKDWHPDLIFMDIGMPEMNGYEATKEIRNYSEYFSYYPHIIALTAHAFTEEKEKILEAGCDYVISKPFMTEIIFQKLQEYLNLDYIYELQKEIDSLSVTSSNNRTISNVKNLSILVVEDNRVNQKLILNFLQKLGYSADIANNGEEVLELIDRHYDIIFMDIEMPKMDGLTTTKKIKELLPPENYPIIIAMTAHDDEQSREICRETGMADYLPKPLKLHKLESLLHKFFSQ